MSDPLFSAKTSRDCNRPLTTVETGWLRCASRMAAAGKREALRLYGTAPGRVALGQGAGGDRTLEIDRACEAAMQEVLEREAPAPHRLISEELGMAGPINAPWAVVMDPLDGSLNAKRGLEPFCASIAIAKGETLEDVAIAYIEDYTRRRCFAAVKGAGLLRAGTPLRTPVTPDPDAEVLNIGGVDKLFASQTIELVLLEAGRPDSHNFRFNDLSVMDAAGRSPDMRVRQIGSLALSLCYVAVGIADILIAAVRSRSVDVAAGFLILAEAGGGVAALTDCDIWTQPLDLEKRCGFVAWRAGLDEADIISRSRDLGRVLLIGA